MSELSGTLRDTSSTLRNQADETAGSFRSEAVKAADQAAEAIRSKSAETMQAGMDALDQVRETTASLGDTLKVSIERQPLTAVTLAAAAGFLLGMIFFRRG
jgi:ElaB/YqjD/DUF883 family membrane-anchored ribosome-binding protein